MPRFKGDTNSASFISELADGLANQGHKVIVLTPYDPLFKNYKRNYKVLTYKYIWPISLHKSGYSRVLQGDKTIKSQMYILSIIMSLSALWNLILVCKKYKIDVVSAHWVIPNGFIAYLASLITGVPYTVTIPGSDVYLAGKSLFFRLPTKLAALNASWVVSDSEYYLDELRILTINPKNVSVIRYGVNTRLLKPSSRPQEILSELKIENNYKVILCLGRFVEKKGFIYVIRALPQIFKKFPKTLLLLVGDGVLKQQYLKNVSDLGVTKNVLLPGSVAYSERSKYYNVADVFVMPSVKDSVGNIDASPVAMMDAMACGVPVVATKYSGSPELVISGKTGFMVKEKNSNEIAQAVINLFQNKNKKNMRLDVRRVAINNFSLEKTANSYTRIFAKII